MKSTRLFRRIVASAFVTSITGLLSLAQAAVPEEGFKSLFNGKDLSGWDGNKKYWSVKEGAIVGMTTPENPTPGNTFLIWRDGLVDDFELRFSYKFTVNNGKVSGNSGVQYRSKDFGDYVVGGYQADFEAGDTYSGILYEERMSRGIMAERGQKVVWGEDGKKQVTGTVGDSKAIQAAIHKEGWNEYVVIAKGYQLIHKINGHVTVEVTDNDPAKRVRSGVLAFQVHAGPPMTVEFKDIRLKRLPLGDLKKVVLNAGHPSHGPGEHEHNAGIQLLHKCLLNTPGVLPVFYLNGWPKDVTAYDNADAVLVYCDGGGGHPFVQANHLKVVQERVNQGMAVGCLHYGVEVPKENGGPEFLKWIGGYFETHWSVNPHWMAEFKEFPKHPVANGVNPFKMQDEWYFHMRFPENLTGVTPILSAVAPASTMEREDGPHSGNPSVRDSVKKGEAQHLMWVFQRPDGGRGFGFTGGHFHKNWGNNDFRRVVLNAILWMVKVDVPAGGVQSAVSEEDLKANLDPKGR